MIDIEYVIQKAIERAQVTEQLPDFSRKDAALLETLRKRNYPTNRDMSSYFEELPMLQSLLTSETRVLDIGTGNGIALSEIASHYGCVVTGTGVSPIENNNIDFIVSEASSLPFKDTSFDVVISVHGISWAPNQIKAMKEAIRVLKPKSYCLVKLIKFSSSVEIWYGDEFWDGIGVDKQEFMREYDFHEDISVYNTDIKIHKFPMEDRMYKIKYYLECYKRE